MDVGGAGDEPMTSAASRNRTGLPNGIYRMSPDVDGPGADQQTTGPHRAEGRSYTVLCLTRSSVDSGKMDEAMAIRAAFLIGATVDFAGSTPAGRQARLGHR